MYQWKKINCGAILLLFSQAFFSAVVFAQVLTAEPLKIFHKDNNTGKLLTDNSQLQTTLLSNNQPVFIAIPLPNGDLVNFKLIPESVMAEGLARKYPNIRTFSGTSLDNPNHTGRFDITPNGFHGMFNFNGKRIFIEPENIYIQVYTQLKASKAIRVFDDKSNQYKSYSSQDSGSTKKLVHKFHPPKKIEQQIYSLVNSQWSKTQKTAKSNESESAIKTYRIAISAAAEYTEFNGGNVDSAMAEIITLVNRLNQVYQHDLAIKLELVENNDLLVFNDASSDPFNNDSDDGEVNTSVIDDIIGSDNYDIGHIVNTAGGGLAVLGAVCHPFYKGDGVTGSPNPTNDAFYIDYVAHEIGHQFGANHTFNGTADACSGNRVASSAYEVGSGSTIMSYAGICGDQNLQSHSDAFFHARSIDQINAYLQEGTGSNCGVVSGDINKSAIVDAGLDYTIPARTPFKLSGSATDADSNNLSYSWQQFDLGSESSSLAQQIDDGTRPLFRAFLPISEANRYFPQLSDVLNNTQSIGESLPTTNRELNFRLMVFDNEGGVNFDETKLTVIDSGEAFSLNIPILGDAWTASSNNISWQVAETDIEPINCATVDMLLSRDGGETFDITLASQVINSGSADISLGDFCADEINTSQAKVKLVCGDNIFFTINNGVFSIDKALSSADITITSQQTMSLVQGDSLMISTTHFTYACELADSITIQNGDDYTFSGATLTPNSDFSGELSVSVVASKDNITSEAFIVSVTVEAKPEPEPEPVQPASKSSGSIYWLMLFVFVIPWRNCFLLK